MILFLIFIIAEAVTLALGIGFGFDLVLSNSPASAVNWPIIGASGAVGLLLGLLFAWLAMQVFIVSPKMAWLWLYTFLSAWVIGGAVFYVRANLVHNHWQFVGIAATFGSLPGLLLGGLLAWKAALHQTIVTTAPIETDTDDEDAASFYTNAYIPARDPLPTNFGNVATAVLPTTQPVPTLDARLQRVEQYLLQELQKLEKTYQGSQGQLLELADQQLAATFLIQIYLGQLTFYIVCTNKYPRTAPAVVMLEVIRTGDKLAREFDYEEHLLKRWTRGYGLETIIKDGILQVEEALIA